MGVIEYNLHGGVNTVSGTVERMDVHGGVVYIRGVVGTLVTHGGVIYDQRPCNRVEYVTDKMSDGERERYRQRISELERKAARALNECDKLRARLKNEKAVEVQVPSEDALCQRIRLLESALNEEKAKHAKDVDDLNYRIDVAMEINAKLRNRQEPMKRSQDIVDDHIDILATMMALFPYTPDDDLFLEFGIPKERIRYVAQVFNVMKSKAERDAAREYLQKQKMQLVDRRGGNKTKKKKKKKNGKERTTKN